MNKTTIPGFQDIETPSNQTTDIKASLEGGFIEEYLLSNGYRMMDLQSIPIEEARILRMEACRYAALKLAEIEARSTFRKVIDLPD